MTKRQTMKPLLGSGKFVDPLVFSAKLRAARAVLGWSQSELGRRAGVTQRAIYRLEMAAVRPRELTQARIEKAISQSGCGFEALPGGGFKLLVPARLLNGSRRTAGRN